MKYSDQWAKRQARILGFTQAVSLEIDAPAFQKWKKSQERDPKFAAETDARQKRAISLAIAYEMNGAGLFVDQYLRKFLREYNARVLNGHGAQMPMSFNVANAFVEPDEQTLILRLQ